MIAALPPSEPDPALNETLRFAPNISFMFAERPFIERLDAAKAAGFDAVELHFPYAFPVEIWADRLEQAGLRLTGLNTAPGDVEAGEWGLAGLPGREEAFRRHFDEAFAYAQRLSCPAIHVMGGVVPPQMREEALATYIRNVRSVAREIAGSGVTLLLEPLNSRDKPDYIVSRSDDVVKIINEIGEPNVKLLFDVYHVQIMEGDLLTRLARHWSHVGHVQVAAVPSRHEPDEGEVAIGAIFAALRAHGYEGRIGLEYKPRGATEAGLGWLKPYRG
jgi:hydroxypyruvate isomerase